MSNEITQQDEVVHDIQPEQNLSPAFAMAMNSNMDMEKLEKVLALQRDWERDNAVKAFNRAFADFQSQMPVIVKDGHVNFTFNGKVTDYHHATLAGALDQLRKPLGDNGLSVSWDIREIEGGLIGVTVILRHVDGHAVSTVMTAPSDQTGGKNAIQAKGSTISYLQRYTLFAIVGAASEDDNDATGEVIPVTLERINAKQQDVVRKAISNKGITEKEAISDLRKKKLNIESIEDIPVTSYEAVLAWAKRNIAK